MEITIEDLSPELLVIIFSHYIEANGHMRYLRNVTPVCRKWRMLSSTPSLWQSVKVRNLNCVLSIARRGLLQHTKSLKLPDLTELQRQRLSLKVNPYFPAMISEGQQYRQYSMLHHIRDLRSLEIPRTTIINENMMRFVAEKCPNLERLSMKNVRYTEFQNLIRHEDLDPILTKCGPKLKHLDFSFCSVNDGEPLITQIGVKCTSLEVLEWRNYGITFHIDKIVCLPLRKLHLEGCKVVMTGEKDCLGLKDLEVFAAVRCDFRISDIYSLLKNSRNLKHLELDWNENLVLNDVSKIPSNEVRFLTIWLRDDTNVVPVEQAVHKWKRTLVHLKIVGCRRTITSVLNNFLEDNQCPKLKTLCIEKDFVDHTSLQIFIKQCKDLKVLKFQDTGENYGNRTEILKFAISCG